MLEVLEDDKDIQGVDGGRALLRDVMAPPGQQQEKPREFARC